MLANLDSSDIKQFSVPDYIASLGLDRPASLELFPISGRSVLLNVEMASHIGSVRVENLPFTSRAGTDEMTLESGVEGQPWSITLRFITSQRAITFAIHMKYEGLNVKRQLEAIRFSEALAAGGLLRVGMAETGQVIAQLPVESGRFGESQPHVVSLLETLLEIQERTNRLFSLPYGPLDSESLATAEAVLKGIRGEPVRRRVNKMAFSITSAGRQQLLDDAQQTGGKLSYTRVATEEIELFGTTIPMGTVVETIDALQLTPDSLVRLSEAAHAQGVSPVEVTLRAVGGGVNSTARFVDWLQPDEAKLLRETFGLTAAKTEEPKP